MPCNMWYHHPSINSPLTLAQKCIGLLNPTIRIPIVVVPSGLLVLTTDPMPLQHNFVSSGFSFRKIRRTDPTKPNLWGVALGNLQCIPEWLPSSKSCKSLVLQLLVPEVPTRPDDPWQQ